MRRMRDLPPSVKVMGALAAVGALSTYLGYHHFSRGGQHDAFSVAKPSEFRPRSHEVPPGHDRRIASERALQALDKNWHRFAEDEKKAEAEAPTTFSSLVNRSISKLKNEPVMVGSIDGVCSSIEFRGDAPEILEVTQEEWSRVMSAFHSAKGELLSWLNQNKAKFPAETHAQMGSQLRALKLARPPSKEEPDLSWRGIGVWSVDRNGAPVIRIGGGFVKMMRLDPSRGKFELTRLMAQTWAPCELERVSAGNPWTPLTDCLEVDTSQGCAVGTYSEAGWAVSSVVAAAVADPGCSLPALKDARHAQCITQFPTTPAQPASSRDDSWSASNKTDHGQRALALGSRREK